MAAMARMDDAPLGPLLSAAAGKKRGRKKDPSASPLIGLKTTMLKTSLCRHWDRGHCKYGDQCGFAHGEDELSCTAPGGGSLLGSSTGGRIGLQQHQLSKSPEPEFQSFHQQGTGMMLPMSTIVPQVPQGLNPTQQQWSAALQFQQQQLQQQQQKIQQQQQQLQQLQHQHNAQIMQQQIHQKIGQQQLPRNIMQTGTTLQPQPAVIPSVAPVAVAMQNVANTTTTTVQSLGDSLGKWSNGSPSDKPLVTSYVGLPLEHSVKASTIGGVGLANTVSIMPLANSTGQLLNTTQDSTKSENPLSTNPDLLHLVLSQRRTKGLIIRLGNEPLVALPGVGAFSFNYKSVKKEHSHKLQVGCKVDFRLSQTHPPRAVSLRLLGDPQNVDMSAVQEQLTEAVRDKEEGGLSQSIQSLENSVDGKAKLSVTINSDSTPDWPTTGTLLSNWNETARTEELERREEKEIKPVPLAAVAAGLCPLIVCASKMPRRNSTTRRPPVPAVPAAEADVDAILAEILDLTDSPVTSFAPPPQPQQPSNIVMPPDQFPENALNSAAWTVGLGGFDTKGWGNSETITNINNLAASLTMPMTAPLSQTFPPPGTNPVGGRRLHRFASFALELQVLKIQMECLFPKSAVPYNGDEWWAVLEPQNGQSWPRLLSIFNVVTAFPQLLGLPMGSGEVKRVAYDAVTQYAQLNDFPEVDPFGAFGNLAEDANAQVIVNAVAAKQRIPSGQLSNVSISSYTTAYARVLSIEYEKATAANASLSDISLRETQASAAKKLSYVLHSYEL